MNTIEFTHILNINPDASRHKTEHRLFEDRILKSEYRDYRLKFADGDNWFRILPAICPSALGWMPKLEVLNFPGGRFVHPRTLAAKARGVFDHAYSWAKINCPKALFSKENREGARLLTDPMRLCWVVVEKEGHRPVPRLLLATGYDGSRGGNPGLGHQILRAALETDEQGNVVTDAIDPNAGLRLCVEKKRATGAKYPSYTVRVGRMAMPINALIEAMAPEDRQALTPLENVIERIDEEEQWQFLAKLIAPSTVAEIRASF